MRWTSVWSNKPEDNVIFAKKKHNWFQLKKWLDKLLPKMAYDIQLICNLQIKNVTNVFFSRSSGHSHTVVYMILAFNTHPIQFTIWIVFFSTQSRGNSHLHLFHFGVANDLILIEIHYIAIDSWNSRRTTKKSNMHFTKDETNEEEEAKTKTIRRIGGWERWVCIYLMNSLW